MRAQSRRHHASALPGDTGGSAGRRERGTQRLNRGGKSDCGAVYLIRSRLNTNKPLWRLYAQRLIRLPESNGNVRTVVFFCRNTRLSYIGWSYFNLLVIISEVLGIHFIQFFLATGPTLCVFFVKGNRNRRETGRTLVPITILEVPRCKHVDGTSSESREHDSEAR